MIVGPMANKLFTRQFIKNNVNIEWNADNSKIQNELGIKFRPLKDSMVDGFQALVDANIFATK